MDAMEAKYLRLQNRLTDLAINNRFALAFSGGVDSRFIAHTALRIGLRPLLIHAVGPHIAQEEVTFARDWATENGADFCQIEVNPLDNPDVANNDKKRCYYCKRDLFSRLQRQAGELPLCDGTQANDLTGYRPGIAALRELGVISPLAEAELTKPEIRRLAAQTGMQDPGQRARPCLLTRFDYLLRPSSEQLNAIDKAERAVENELCRWLNAQPNALSPDFRLRQLSAKVIELHLTPLDVNNSGYIDTELKRRLTTAIEKEIAYPLRDIKIMDKLSGYFDRKE